MPIHMARCRTAPGRDLQTLCWLCHREGIPEKNQELLENLRGAHHASDDYWARFGSLSPEWQAEIIYAATARPL